MPLLVLAPACYEDVDKACFHDTLLFLLKVEYVRSRNAHSMVGKYPDRGCER